MTTGKNTYTENLNTSRLGPPMMSFETVQSPSEGRERADPVSHPRLLQSKSRARKTKKRWSAGSRPIPIRQFIRTTNSNHAEY